MGFWDNDEVSVVSRRSHDGKTKYSVERNKKSRSRSRSRSRAPTRGASSIFGGGGGKHSSSRSSFFSLPVGSRSSFFGLGGRSPSYYRRSPRKNFLARAWKKLKHLLRSLTRHARRNPLKVLSLIIVPLVACGALTALLARFGIKLPGYVERLITTAGKMAGGGGVGIVGEAVKMAGDLAGKKGGSDGGSGSGYGSGIGSRTSRTWTAETSWRDGGRREEPSWRDWIK